MEGDGQTNRTHHDGTLGKRRRLPFNRYSGCHRSSISAGSYTVDDRVINEVRALPFTAESAICETEKGQYQLDLKEVNRLLLIHCGIPEENISVSGLCTERERELFFSHRRDKGKTGRMMSFIGMKEA